MKILITGATGLVGSALLEELFLQGMDDVRILTRNKEKAKRNIPFPVSIFEWNPEEKKIEDGALKEVDIVIHLAGENVADERWTPQRKNKILNSRVESTNLLMEEIKKLETPPKKFISSSAVGIYGNRKEESINEISSLGEGFLVEVCKKWEEIVLNHNISEMKSHCLRTGIVLSRDGGALQKMLLPFMLGIGGKLGSGDQYMSWIHIDDLVGQFLFLIKNNALKNIYNGVSPRPVTNYIFTKIFGKEIKRPTLFPVPKTALKLLFGDMSKILLEGQKVIPTNFMNEGYHFKYRGLRDALRDLLKYNLSGEKELLKYQWLNKKPIEIFDFFSNEFNLEKITPKYLNFKVLGKDTEEIQVGTIIDYKLSLHGIPLKWKSQIKNFNKNHSFIDEQLNGPYAKWRHYHGFIPTSNGTLIKDLIIYKPPLGLLGRIFAGSFIKKDLNKIFNHRTKVISEIFVN